MKTDQGETIHQPLIAMDKTKVLAFAYTFCSFLFDNEEYLIDYNYNINVAVHAIIKVGSVSAIHSL
jgi:hypothetical protein